MFQFRGLKRNWWRLPRISLKTGINSALDRILLSFLPFPSLRKVVEVPDIQMRGKVQQGVSTHTQHVVDTVDVENHIIQKRINQVTKHVDVPILQIVERTIESAQLADR